ncbi:MAG: HAMP domain-containing protein [Actinobacteria bacterium]|nr:HAMP domain-containing protein [Actinomycetota bacterium]
MSEKIKKKMRGRGRSVILLQITVLVIIVVIVSGALSLILFRNSMNRMIEKSKDKLIESEASLIMSSHDFLSAILTEIQALKGISSDPDTAAVEILEAYSKGEISGFQKAASDVLKSQVDSGLQGVVLAIESIPPSTGFGPGSTIIFSSDNKYIFEEVPEEVVEMAEKEGNTYRLFENGIEKFGLDGEYLVTSYVFKPYPESTGIYYFDFKPMHEELASINDFYNKESKRTYMILGLVIGGSILVLILITFFILSVLIRRKITRPIDELSEAAEQVMDGNLDVEVEIRKGEEFEGLKRAFNEMLKSIRDVIARATGEDV